MTSQQHPAVQAAPILDVAAALDLTLVGRRAHCFNEDGHAGGRDENPSLTFFPDYQRFKCYSCGVHGDSIDLVRQVRDLSFLEAVDWLQGQFGASKGTLASPTSSPPATRNTPDLEAIEVYRRLYEAATPPSADSEEGIYLTEQRGLDLDVAAAHGVRVITNPWVFSQIDQQSLDSAGLLSRDGNFLFTNHRLLFFFLDGDRPVYMCGRDVTGRSRAKELSPARLQCPVPFNRNVLATDPDSVCICEGPIDTLSAVQLGHPAIGVPGTSGFCDEWFQLLRPVPCVKVLFDNDESGRREGAELRTQLCLRGIAAEAVSPALGKDVNDLLIRSNKEVS